MTNNIAQAVMKRDHMVVLTGLAAVIFAATIYILFMAGQFNKPMDVAIMTTAHAGMPGAQGFLMLFSMWTIMQVAMMSPAAVPIILMHGKIERHN